MPGWQFSTPPYVSKVGRILLRLLHHRGFRWALVLLVLAGLIQRTDQRAWVEALAHFDFRHGILMIVIYLILILLFAWRWQLIATTLGVQADYRGFVRGLWFSQAAGELGPPLLAGEIARFHALQGQGDNTRILLSQALDRCSGHLVLIVLAILALPVSWPLLDTSQVEGSLIVLLVLTGAAGAGFLLFYHLQRRIERENGLARNLARVFNPLDNPGHYLVSVLIQCLLTLNWVLAAAGLGFDQSLGRIALLGPFLLLGLNAIPGLISDWGKREAAAILLLSPAGLGVEQSLAVSLIYGVTHFITALPGWCFMVAGKRLPGQALTHPVLPVSGE